MVRLGAGRPRRQAAAPKPACAAAIQTLSKFMRLAASHGVDEIVAAATSAVREAENGADFVGAVKRELGLHVRVISGHGRGAADSPGGRLRGRTSASSRRSSSTSAAAARRSRSARPSACSSGRSFKLGVIRLTERFAKTRSAVATATSGASCGTSGARRGALPASSCAQARVDRVIGTSGTILSLGALADGAAPTPTTCATCACSAKALHASAQAADRDDARGAARACRTSIRGAPTWRRPAPCCSTRCSTASGAEEITLCDFALREGLVLDYIQRNAAHIRTVDRYPDVRRRSVIELAERYNYLPAHAQQVARLALALFDAHARPARARPARARVARIRRAAPRHRHAHQLRAPSQALVLPDPPRRPARLRARGSRGDRRSSRAITGRPRRRSRTKASAICRASGGTPSACSARIVRLAEGPRPQPRAGGHAPARRTRGRRQLTVQLERGGDAELETVGGRTARDGAGRSARGTASRFEVIAAARRQRPTRTRPPHARHARHAAPRTPAGCSSSRASTGPERPRSSACSPSGWPPAAIASSSPSGTRRRSSRPRPRPARRRTR